MQNSTLPSKEFLNWLASTGDITYASNIIPALWDAWKAGREQKDKTKHRIEIIPYSYTCGDGCCYETGIDIKVDGEMVCKSQPDVDHALQQILQHFGVESEVVYIDEAGEETCGWY